MPPTTTPVYEFTDTKPTTTVVNDTITVEPYSGYTVTGSVAGVDDMVSVTLSPQYYSGYDLGSLSDPQGSNGKWNAATDTFTEDGAPGTATQILDRLVYTPPKLPNGQGQTVTATASIDGQTDTVGPQTLQVVTPPTITGTVANQPLGPGSTIRPFAPASIHDSNFGYNTTLTSTITVTDGGTPTDADGLLTGTGLSKTGVGTYTLTGSPYSYSASSALESLLFTPTAVAAGATRTTSFQVAVNDAGANLASQTDNTTSVLVYGNDPMSKPLIAGTWGPQTVASGATIDPFSGATVSDLNSAATESATLTVSGGGSLSGSGLTDNGNGTYTIAKASPQSVTSTLNALVYTPPALASGQTTNNADIRLDVTDGTATATDTNTSITETATSPGPVTGDPGPVPSPTSNNFSISDQTTHTNSTTPGDSYSGPVAGVQWQFVDVTPDNLNINAMTQNAFIHSGSGNDALAVMGGTNVLDGGTGSNFLSGGTGNDTFFVDDRSAASDIWSTISNFHAGDTATVFGVTQAGFNFDYENNQGAAGYAGLTLHVTGGGKPTASFTLAGYTTSDMNNGRLNVSFGQEADGTNYMVVQGH
jgi:hypothetical protein